MQAATIPADTVPPTGRETLAAIGMMILAWIIGIGGYTVLLYTVLGLLWFSHVAMFALQSAAFLSGIVPLHLARGPAAWAAIGCVRTPMPTALLWAVGLFVAVQTLDGALVHFAEISGAGDDPFGSKYFEDTIVGDGLPLTLVAVALIAPIGEEVAFRGVLYGWLRRHLGPQAAALLQAVPFGLLHGEPWNMVAAGIAGLLFAVTRERTGSLWPAIAGHVFINAAAMLEIYLALEGPASG